MLILSELDLAMSQLGLVLSRIEVGDGKLHKLDDDVF